MIEEMKDEYIVTSILIVCVTVLETVALLQNVDGQLFATVMAGLIGIVAYLLPSPVQRRKGE